MPDLPRLQPDSPFLQHQPGLAQGAVPDVVREIVLDVLTRHRAEIVAAANKGVNVPLISESTEAKLLDAVYGMLLEGVETVLGGDA